MPEYTIIAKYTFTRAATITAESLAQALFKFDNDQIELFDQDDKDFDSVIITDAKGNTLFESEP